MITYKFNPVDLVLSDLESKDRKYILKINDLPVEEKPREKLLKFGPSALSVQELLAILLVNGTKKEDVLAMSDRILKEYGERTLAGYVDAKRMATDLDIPLIKAEQIVACAELGRRFFEKKGIDSVTIRTAKDVFEYVSDMRTLPKEHLRGLYLNSHHKLIHDEVLSIGTLNTNLIHPREVFKPALEFSAAAVILVHNHPSGEVAPSIADIEITKQLVQAGNIMGIRLLDHVVVSQDKFMSITISYE